MNAADLNKSVQFIVGVKGKPTAVVLDIELWDNILELIENIEDFKLAAQRLKNWRSKKNWTSWDEFEKELEADELQTVD